jgi:hypothetical protein
MTIQITSRQRMLAALNCQPVDHTPCAFMMFKGLKNGCQDELEFYQRQLEMGLDVVVDLPPRPPSVVNDHYNLHGLPVCHHPSVEIKAWIEGTTCENPLVMVKEYHTPAGILRAEVRQTDDWRWGNHVPFLDDFIIPRSQKFLVTEPKDLAALRFLLVPPTKHEIAEFHRQSRGNRQFAEKNELLISGGWGVGADMIGWLCGLENMVFMAHDQPQFLSALLGIISEWNQARMQTVLGSGVDLYIKRAWYENCDFWTPTTWKQFIQPILISDAALAHAAGAKFGYLITSNAMPLIDMIVEAGVDVLIGVDPKTYNLHVLAEKTKGKMCLWGGVNGHLTVERGTPEEVSQEIRQTMEILAPNKGFILSPVDNVRDFDDAIRRNVRTLIQQWKISHR